MLGESVAPDFPINRQRPQVGIEAWMPRKRVEGVIDFYCDDYESEQFDFWEGTGSGSFS